MKTFRSTIYLTVALCAAFLLAHSWQVLNAPPRSVHQWRQSDCAAYVKNYYRNGTGLFSPGTFFLGGKGGRVASEFPILYYLAAKIERLTGEHYWVIRGLTFLCFVAGLVALLGCVRLWIPSVGYAVFPVVLMASSPYVYYYALNFLPNVPALSFSFVGLYFFLQYEKSRRLLYLAAGTVLFVLATALKPTDGGILWAAYLLARGWEKRKSLPRRNTSLLPMLASALVVVASIAAWTVYVNTYNNQNGNHQNLIGIYPIWQMDADMLRYTIQRMVTEWSRAFQHWALHLFLLGCFCLCVFRWRRLHPFLRRLTAALFAGVFVYSLLWFRAFTDHDYYQLPFVLPAVFLIITTVEWWVREGYPKASSPMRYAVAVALIGLTVVSLLHNASVQWQRYGAAEARPINPVLYQMEAYLQSIGVSPTDAVVCVPDPSPNTSLNAINRYGYTEAFTSEAFNLYHFQAAGAAYLIVADSAYLQRPFYKPFLQKQVGLYKGVAVFDIRKR